MSYRKAKKNIVHIDEVNYESELTIPHLPVSFHNQRLDNVNNNMGGQLKGDRRNILLLTYLYILQGIPLGLTGSIPLLLQGKNISYKEQAIFSLAFWPFSVKLLWAPIVDSVFVKRFGRRKTWLVLMQYLLGLFMILLSSNVDSFIGNEDVNVHMLTAIFFCLNIFAATQDIAVDGWALTMLSRDNVGLASTCNSVGQSAGFFIGNVLFLALQSSSFCNSYLRWTPQEEGLVTLQGFLYFWGIVFFVSTTLVMLLKREKAVAEERADMSPLDVYKQLLRIMQLRPVLLYCGILLTCKIAFAATDSVTGLKLMEMGVRKENLAMLAVPMVPIQILLPLVISKFTSGPSPFTIWLRAYPCRLIMGLIFMSVMRMTPMFKNEDGSYSFAYFSLLLVVYAVHQVTLYCMFVAVMAFHARIADPSIGGTYMTLLNTVSNLGGNWPSTVALWFVDSLTWRECVGASNSFTKSNVCTGELDIEACAKAGGHCSTLVDGYYIESGVLVAVGILWFLYFKRHVLRLQSLSDTVWRVS